MKMTRSLALTVAALAAVGAVTGIDFALLHVNSSTAACTYLVLILALATRVGLRESVIASVASVVAYNYYFLPPIRTFTIADPQNWIAFIAFVITAMTVSQLSGESRRRTLEARARQDELQRMYDFSRTLMLGDETRSLPEQVVHGIAAQFQVDHVSLYDSVSDAVCRLHSLPTPIDDAALRRVARLGGELTEARGATLVIPVSLGGRTFGSLGIHDARPVPLLAIQAVAQLIAIAMERGRTQSAAARLEATSQSEKLKSTLLDALAHEFKTPLTSIKAATSTLLSRPPAALDPVALELTTVIDEEADRMTALVTDSIELARFGAGNVVLQREVSSPAEIVREAVRQMSPLLDSRAIHVLVSSNIPAISVDVKLVGVALRQLIQNALKYSVAGSEITVSAHQQEGEVVFTVSNQGAPIPESELPLLFEKFYRGENVRGRTAGTGMGLSITKDIVNIHQGRIWVHSGEDSPTEFCFTLPIGQIPRQRKSA